MTSGIPEQPISRRTFDVNTNENNVKLKQKQKNRFYFWMKLDTLRNMMNVDQAPDNGQNTISYCAITNSC